MVNVRFEDPGVATEITAWDVVRARNLIITGEISLTNAESWVRGTVHPNRRVVGLSNRYNVANLLLHSNATERGSIAGNVGFNLIKETRVDVLHPTNTTVRMRVEARSTWHLSASMQFRRNGVAVSEEITLPISYAWYVHDFTNVVATDLIQVWGRMFSGGTSDRVFARNLEVRGNTIPIPSLIEAVRIGSAGATTPAVFTSML